MKIFFIIFILIIASIDTNAQDTYEPNPDAKFFYEMGLDYLNQLSYKPAIFNLKKALDIDPEYTDARFALSQALKGSNEADAAKEALSQSVAADAGSLSSIMRIGNYEFEEKNYNSAISYYRLADEKFPDNNEVLFACGKTYYNLLHIDSSEWYLQKLYFKDKTNIDNARLLARVYSENKRFNKAIDLYTEIKKDIQLDADEYGILTELMVSEYRYEEAQFLCDEGLRYYPLSAELLFSYGLLFEMQGDTVEAMKKYKRAFNNNAGDIRSGLKLADYNMSIGLVKEAAEQYLNLTDKSELGLICYEKAANAHLILKDSVNAASLYADLYKINFDEKAFIQAETLYQNMLEFQELIGLYDARSKKEEDKKIWYKKIQLSYEKLGNKTMAEQYKKMAEQ